MRTGISFSTCAKVLKSEEMLLKSEEGVGDCVWFLISARRTRMVSVIIFTVLEIK